MKIEIRLNEEQSKRLTAKLDRFFEDDLSELPEEFFDVNNRSRVLRFRTSERLKILLLLWLDESITINNHVTSAVSILYKMTQTIKTLRAKIEELEAERMGLDGIDF